MSIIIPPLLTAALIFGVVESTNSESYQPPKPLHDKPFYAGRFTPQQTKQNVREMNDELRRRIQKGKQRNRNRFSHLKSLIPPRRPNTTIPTRPVTSQPVPEQSHNSAFSTENFEFQQFMNNSKIKANDVLKKHVLPIARNEYKEAKRHFNDRFNTYMNPPKMPKIESYHQSYHHLR